MIKQLTQEQWDILDGMRSNLGLAADLAQAKISLILPLDRSRQFAYIAAGQDTGSDLNTGGGIVFLSVFDQAEPLTRSENSEPEEITRAEDEPLVTRALEEKTVTEGFREFSAGQFARLKVYPIFDADYASNLCYRRLSSIDGLVLVNAEDRRILAANNAARHIYRVLGVGSLVGRYTTNPEINWNGIDNVLRTGAAEEEELQQKGLFLDCRFIPLQIDGNIKRIIAVIEDVTQLKLKDEELRVKAAVIREIHHRVKNNLQTIASLLRLEQRRAASEETRFVLRDSINRISSIALVHEYLSGQGTETVDINQLGNGIFRTVMSSMKAPDLELEMNFSADDLRLPSQQAASLALVLNELLQNALEHGFENKKRGKLTATITRLNQNGIRSDNSLDTGNTGLSAGMKKGNDTALLLQVEDNGKGLPWGFDLHKTQSLGLKIVQTVVQSDLKGTFSLEPRPKGKGTVAKVRFLL